MKKILAVVLAIMMMFSCFAVSSSAVSTNLNVTATYTPGSITTNQVAIMYNFGSGSSLYHVSIYNADTGAFDKDTVTGYYLCLPTTSTDLVVGSVIQMPVVSAPEGQQLTGWRCNVDNQLYAATAYYTIPAEKAGDLIQFTAEYTTAEPDTDTMATIMNILIKVFGGILGFLIFNGDTEAGVAFMQNALSGLMG